MTPASPVGFTHDCAQYARESVRAYLPPERGPSQKPLHGQRVFPPAPPSALASASAENWNSHTVYNPTETGEQKRARFLFLEGSVKDNQESKV